MVFLTPSSFTDESPDERRIYNKIASRLLPYLLLLYVISFLDRVNVGFAKLQMASDIGLSDAAYGFGAGVFFLGYCACEIPSNLMLQKFGAKFWIARIMVVWGIVTTCMLLVTSEPMFHVLRFLLGVSEAGFYPGIILYLTYWFPSRLRSQICAYFFLGITLSVILGGPMSGYIMQNFGGVWGLRNWQWLFLIEGVPAIIFGFITYFYLDDGPAKAKWLGDDEKRLVLSALDAEDRAKRDAGHGHNFGHALKDVNVWLLSITNFALLGGVYGISFWLPQIIKDLGVKDLVSNGMLNAVPFGSAAIAMVLISRHSDRSGERKWHIIGCMSLGAVGLTLSGFFGHNPYLSLFGLCLATIGCMAGSAVLWSIPGALLAGAGAAAGIALMATLGNLSGYVLPFVIGWVKQTTGQVEFGLYAMALILIVGALVTACVPQLRKTAPTSKSASGNLASDLAS